VQIKLAKRRKVLAFRVTSRQEGPISLGIPASKHVIHDMDPEPLDRSGKIVEQLLLNSRIVGSSNRIL